MCIHPKQLFFHIHISVKENIAVCRMIILSVEIQEGLIGKLRDHIRISAGFKTIGCIRKKGIQDFSFQNTLRRRKSTLHFVINYTVDLNLALLILQFIMPALLAKDFFFTINIRIKDSIQINMHQILEILVIAAGYRIDCFIRISHGI